MQKTIVASLAIAAFASGANLAVAQAQTNTGTPAVAPTSQQAIPDVMVKKNGQPQTSTDGQNGTGNGTTEPPTSGPNTQIK